MRRPNQLNRTEWQVTYDPGRVTFTGIHPELSTQTLNPTPETVNPKPQTLNPTHQTLNPKPQTLNPKPRTLNPQP